MQPLQQLERFSLPSRELLRDVNGHAFGLFRALALLQIE
jgi:hypothetical protein